ncbi:hypothetical protein ADK77_27555 [Streptomyces antibioticus]|nr:hypothetical protein ADK77_27555 [Streptomyces antibioticus]
MTGAACAPLAGGLMGMLMLGMAEAPGAEPAAPPGPVAPGIPAIRCWPGPGVRAPALVAGDCDDWPQALRSPRAPPVVTMTAAIPAAARDRRPGVRRFRYMVSVPR